MKTKLFIFIFLIIGFNAFSQKNIRIYVGSNLTTLKPYGFINGTDISDSLPFDYNWILLPSFGFEYNIPINKKLNFTTGFGVDIYGCSDYWKNVEVDNPDTTFYIFVKKYPNLANIYLSIPISFSYKILKNIDLNIGYKINYVVRKNQSSMTYDKETLDVYNYFNDFLHFFNIGIEGRYKNFSIKAVTLYPLSRIYDTKNNESNGSRAYGNIIGLNLTLGYIISE
ncbi:MAG: hypothetical protein R2771_09340 [Saprospiraceae bacterium]